MGSIERFRRTNGHRAGRSAPAPAPIPPRSGGGIAVGGAADGPAATGLDDVGFVGRPVDYEPSAFSLEESWQLLSPSMREWAQGRTGPPIRDPHTGVPTVYAYCRVTPDEHEAGPATYELLLFGKRGLVVSEGTTHDLVPPPGVTKWRHRRFDLPVDPAAIRNDHRRGAPGNSAADGGAGAGPMGTGPAAAIALPLDVTAGSGPLPADMAERFGNLPLPTQRFLLEPFTATGRPPVQARVHPAIFEQGGVCQEMYWTCLFNAGWLAFAAAERSVPSPSPHQGPETWQLAVEDLRRTPWTVAAWVAAIDKSAGAPPERGSPDGVQLPGALGPPDRFGPN